MSIIEDEVAVKRSTRKSKAEVAPVLPASFTVDAATLAKLVGPVVKATYQRSGALPILAAVKILVSESTVTLFATDLETAVQVTMPAAGCQSGVFAVNAKSFERFAQAAAGQATFKQSGNLVVASAGDFVARFPAVDPADFPQAMDASPGELFAVDALAIRQAIKRTAFAASTDEARPVLTGVLFHEQAGKLAVAATDSYRIGAAVVGEVPFGEKPLLVPAKTLLTVDKLIGDRDSIFVAVGERTITFQVDGTTVQSRLIEGDFPNWRQLLPTGDLAVLRASREAFTTAVERAARFVVDDKTPVRLSISNAGITVALVAQDVADVDGDVACEWGESGTFEVAFNPGYLLAGLRTIEAATIELRFQQKDGKASALLPALVAGDGVEFTYLLMPVRVGS